MFLDMSADYLLWDNTSTIVYEYARAVPAIVDVPPVYNGQQPALSPPPSLRYARSKSSARIRSETPSTTR